METEVRKTSSKTSAPKEKRPTDKEKSKDKSKSKGKDESKVHKLSLKGSSRLVAEFVRLHPRNLLCPIFSDAQMLIESFSVFEQFQYSIHTILYEDRLPENDIKPKTKN